MQNMTSATEIDITHQNTTNSTAEHQDLLMHQKNFAVKEKKPLKSSSQPAVIDNLTKLDDEESIVEKEEPRTLTWIEWFCSLEENIFLLQIDREFIMNPENHRDLAKAQHLNFPKLSQSQFTDCLKMILWDKSPTP